MRTNFEKLKQYMRGPLGLFTIATAATMLGRDAYELQLAIRLGEIRGAVEVDPARGRYRTARYERATHVQAREIANAISSGPQIGRHELRTGAGAGGITAATTAPSSTTPTIYGHFAVFNQPTEINSSIEGRFIERIAPGAFTKTMQNDRSGMRMLLNHGHDTLTGNAPIASITSLREDNVGAYFEGALLDGVPPLVVSGLRAGQYGSSFRFTVQSEDLVERPTRSAVNPLGLPERTIREASVSEFGPVTFPAYAGATVAARLAAPAIAPTPQRAPLRFRNSEEFIAWLSK